MINLEKFHIYFRYMISGGTAALTNVFLLYVFTDLMHIYYLLSATMSYLIGFFVSFLLQKFWTFRDNDEKMFGQMTVYFAIALANLFVNDLLMYLFVDKIFLNHLIAQVLVSGLIAVYSFAAYKLLVFNSKPAIITNE